MKTNECFIFIKNKLLFYYYGIFSTSYADYSRYVDEKMTLKCIDSSFNVCFFYQNYAFHYYFCILFFFECV